MNSFLTKENFLRRLAVMLFGIVIMGIGVGLFKISLMGNDPSTALVIAIGERINIDFSLVLIAMNCLWFLVELFLERKLIGIGTFINWFCVGPIASFFEKQISAGVGVPENLVQKLLVMVAGVLILSFSCALYQTANLGIAPYDALSLVLSHRSKVKYFWCRIFTDSVCVAIAFFLGGLIGLGTLVCALGLGPFITFFTKYAAEKLVGEKANPSQLH